MYFIRFNLVDFIFCMYALSCNDSKNGNQGKLYSLILSPHCHPVTLASSVEIQTRATNHQETKAAISCSIWCVCLPFFQTKEKKPFSLLPHKFKIRTLGYRNNFNASMPQSKKRKMFISKSKSNPCLFHPWFGLSTSQHSLQHRQPTQFRDSLSSLSDHALVD